MRTLPQIDTTAIPEFLLDDLEAHIVSSVESSLNVREIESLSFSFKYASESLNHHKIEKEILTSVNLIVSDATDTEIAKFRIVFDQDEIHSIKADYILQNDLGDVDWFDDDGEEHDADDPFIKNQITDLFGQLDEINELDEIDGIKYEMLSMSDLGMGFAYFQKETLPYLELVYIREN